MKSCLNTLSGFLAAASAILFVFLATGTLIFFIISQTLFSAGTYKQALEKQDAYERFPGIIAEQLIFQQEQIRLGSSGEAFSPDLARLSQADWEIVLSEILTPESLQVQAESLIDQFIHYITTPGEPLKLKVSLVEFKEKLNSEAGLRALMHMIKVQPECTSDEWARLLYGAQYAQLQNLPYCRPSEDILEAATPSLREALRDVALSIPSETYLDDRSGPASRSSDLDVDGRDDLQRVRRWIGLSLCLPAFLFFLIGVFGVRSLRGFGLWLGLPLMFTGLLTFLAALVSWVFPSWLLTRSYPTGEFTIEGTSNGVAQLVLDVGVEVVHSASRSIGIAGFLIGLVGLGLLAAGLLFGYALRSDKLTDSQY